MNLKNTLLFAVGAFLRLNFIPQLFMFCELHLSV